MRKLGAMEHDECAPWCDHDPANHHSDCDDGYCHGGKECFERKRKMKLSLRKANALQVVIAEQLGERFVGEISIGKYETPDTVLAEATDKLTATIAKKFDLIDVYYSIRQKVGAASASVGISDLLTDLAKIERQTAFLKQLASTTVFTPKIEAIEKALTDLREKKADSVYHRPADSISVSLLTKEEVEGYAKAINTARKEKNRISDKILHLNVSTEIELDEKEIEVLNKYEIL